MVSGNGRTGKGKSMSRRSFSRSSITRSILILLLLLLGACSNAAEREEDARLNTEVAMISGAIRGTQQAGWTDTPVPTETPIPTDTPVPTTLPDQNTEPMVSPEPAAGSGSLDQFFDEPEAPAIPLPTDTPAPTATPYIEPFHTRTPGPGNPTPDIRPLPEDWREWPVVPVISDNAADIYRYGVEKRGTKPRYISRVGDCHSESGVFLGLYDTGPYELADEDRYLESAINYFRGSFNQISYSVHAGISASSVLTSIWSDPYVCNLYESALDCEIRVNNPSIMFVNLGSNWIQGVSMEVYYGYLTDIVDRLISHGILPILSSKADNVEGDWGINETTARVAREYDIPFYNFWAVAQTLPYHGIDPTRDGIHLSMQAWDVRSLYALKTIYAVGQKLELF